MSKPNPVVRDETLTQMVRGFATDLRDHFTQAENEADREQVINRFLALIAMMIGVVLSLRHKQEAVAATLLGVALRLWTKPPMVIDQRPQ